MNSITHRWRSSLPFVIAIAVLAFLCWAALVNIRFPDDGILSILPNGTITGVDPIPTGVTNLKAGDQILAIDGIPFHEAESFYKGKRGGDAVEYTIIRNTEITTITSNLRDPTIATILQRLVPLFVALAFWFVGIGLQTFKPSDASMEVPFTFFQASSMLLAAGALSYSGPLWVSMVFVLFVWLIGPFFIHFHLVFPRVVRFPKENHFLFIVYFLGITGAAMDFMPDVFQNFRGTWIDSTVVQLRLLYAGLSLVVGLSLLYFSYRTTTIPGTRSQIRIVVLGSVLSILPLVTLSIVPEALGLTAILPYAYAFLLLILFPLTYGYAIYRHHLIEIEKHVNRGATYIIVFSILGGIYFVFYALLHALLPPDPRLDPVINTLLVLLLASFFNSMQTWAQSIVDRVFYGSWYDYRSAVNQITQNLVQMTDLHQLASTVSDRIVHTLRLEDVCIFLRDLDDAFSVIEVAPRKNMMEAINLSFPELPMRSLTYLLKIGEKDGRSSLAEALSGIQLTPEEQSLLNSEQIHLWVPILGREKVQGYLALGPKIGGDIFSGEDMDIIRVISWQMGPIIENIHLLTQLREYATELEQRVAERTVELYDAKERVEAILESVGDGVVVTNLENDIVKVNTAFKKLSGYAEAELEGIKFAQLFEQNSDRRVLAEMLDAQKAEAVWSGELLLDQRSGGLFNIQLTLAPVFNQAHQLIGYVGSLHDITKQRELDRLKDQFVSDVSHELRTPVTNLTLYLELMEYASPEKRVKYMDILKGQCTLLSKLVEDILDLSRLEMGKLKRLEFVGVDLDAVVKQIILAHEPLAESAGLSLSFTPGEGMPAVLGEPNQLARVVTNLVANSIRYTSKGHVQVQTYLAGQEVCLEVKDSGIGIEPEDLQHIFERFYRGKQVRQSNIHGTGLGLAIVKEIVDLHSGRISIESVIGGGTVFKVFLPVYHGELEISGEGTPFGENGKIAVTVPPSEPQTPR